MRIIESNRKLKELFSSEKINFSYYNNKFNIVNRYSKRERGNERIYKITRTLKSCYMHYHLSQFFC